MPKVSELFPIGSRRALPASCDEWMAGGPQWGTVTGRKGRVIHLRLDRPIQFPTQEGRGELRRVARIPAADFYAWMGPTAPVIEPAAGS